MGKKDKNREKSIKEVKTTMAILAKPVKVPLTVKADKIEAFKKTFDSKRIEEVQEKTKKITNIKNKG